MDQFWLQAGLSFVVGGAYIALSLWASEKFGSKWGGILLSLPSTSLVSLFFIGWTQGVQTAVAATPIMPAAFAVGVLFLAGFVAFRRLGAVKAWVAAITLWFALTLPLAFYGLDNILLSLAGAAVLFVPILYYFRKIRHQKLESQKYSKREFFGRAIFSGLVVAMSVILAETAGPLWGGLFATFPAAFSAAILLLSRKHGIEFTTSVIKTMPIGNIASIAFAVSVYYTLPVYGLLAGMAISCLASVATASALVRLLKNY